MTTIVLLADIGDEGEYHVGDEAMAEAAADELGARLDLSVVAVSGHPPSTHERYGWATVPRLGFGPALSTDADRDARLAAVLAAAGGDADAVAWDDPAWHLIRAVIRADGVLISGGGNLSSIWPEHVYERAALAVIAQILNRPLVVTGQSVGPLLTPRHGELVSAALRSAALVGVRERNSVRFVSRLGVPPERLVQTIDDAAFLEGRDAAWEPPASPYVAATFAPHSGVVDQSSYLGLIGRTIRRTVESTGLDVVLVPHQGCVLEGARTGDVAFHDAVREASGAAAGRVRSLPILTARAAAEVSRQAALVISSRYHPVVFALMAGVPAVGVCVDAYTSAKIGGAMDGFGMGAYALSVVSLVSGDLDTAIAETWARAAAIRPDLRTTATRRRAESAAWWDAVAVVLDGGQSPRPDDVTPVPDVASGSWSEATSAIRTWADTLSLQVDADRYGAQALQVSVELLRRQVAELELACATLGSDLDEAGEDGQTLRAATRAAHERASEALHRLVGRVEAQPTIDALQAEITALRSTRTFRYLALPRRAYSQVLRVTRRRTPRPRGEIAP